MDVDDDDAFLYGDSTDVKTGVKTETVPAAQPSAVAAQAASQFSCLAGLSTV